MFSLIRSIQERDPAKPTFFEVLLGYNGYHAVLLHRLSHFIWNLNLKAVARFLSNIARIMTGVEIHPAAKIGERLFIDHGTGVVIGATVIIHDDVTIYHGVTLGGVGQGRTTNGRRHPEIMNEAMIGAGAQVLGGLTVGHNAKIGANAVVLKDVPDDCTVIGNPARLVNCKGEPSDFAYGLKREMNDPIAETIDGLVRDIEILKEKTGVKTEPDADENYISYWKGSGI